MPLPVFTCELHARVTLATDLQSMDGEALHRVDPAKLAEVYQLRPEIAAHIRAREIEHRRAS